MKYLALLPVVALISGCANFSMDKLSVGNMGDGQLSEQNLLYVDAQKVHCTGVGPMTCLKVRSSPAEEWQLLYSRIEGFEHQAGYLYQLKIKKTQVENPPADGSSIRYQLIKLIGKQKLDK